MNTPTTSAQTTLIALRTDTGERLTIDDLPLDELRVLSDARQLICPYCRGPLMLKAGAVRVHHFAHLNLDACSAADHEPETDEHRQGKLLLYRAFRPGAVMAEIEHHLPATDQRADVMVLADRRYALEFQQANNTADRWAARHALYAEQGIADIWFLGQARYQEIEPPEPISPYDPLPVPRAGYDAASGRFRTREMERQMLLVAPILSYLDPDTGIVTLLVERDIRHYTLRAYRYRFPLTECRLQHGGLWTPLDPLLADYRAFRQRG